MENPLIVGYLLSEDTVQITFGESLLGLLNSISNQFRKILFQT